MNNITTRQIIIFYFIWSLPVKFLTLPLVLSWGQALVGTAAELLLVIAAIFICKAIRTDGTGPARGANIARGAVTARGAATARILGAVAIPILAYELWICGGILYALLTDNLFESMSLVKFVLPLVLLGLFFCFMPTRAVFRTGEIFLIFVVLAVVFILGPAAFKFDPFALTLDMGSWMPLVRHMVYFESFIFILVFAGEIEKSKRFALKFSLAAIAAAIIGAAGIIMAGGQYHWGVVVCLLGLLLLRFALTFFAIFKCAKGVVYGKRI